MKREKRLTKREKKALTAPAGGGHNHDQHIHCTACGRHLDESEFDGGSATVVNCAHGSSFPSCSIHVEKTKVLLAEHDRTGQPVRAAVAYH